MKKQILVVLSVIALTYSCGKDEPTIINTTEQKQQNSNNNTNTPDKSQESEAPVKRPNDIHMAKRAVVTWKEGVDYLKEFNFDELYRVKNTSLFTLEYLLKFITIYSTEVDGSNHYVFNDDDLKQVSISNIQYKPSNSNEGNITFDLSYKEIKGAKASLPFNKHMYYSDFVTLNSNMIKQKYMHGVYENLDVFLRNMLVFDKTKIIPELVTKSKNSGSNSIDVTLKLISGDGKETEIATIHKTITGFKPLSDLKNELVLAHGFELGEYFGKKFRDAKDGDLLERVKLIDPRVWIGKAQFSIKRNGNFISLNKEEVSLRGENSIVTLYTPSDHLGENKDIYLKEPHFTVIQAKKKGNYLRLVLQLVAVNDESLSGVEIPLNIHLIKP